MDTAARGWDAVARHRVVRLARLRLRASPTGESHLEGRRWRDDRGDSLLSNRLRGWKALSARRTTSHRTARIRQVWLRRGPALELHAGADCQRLCGAPAQLSWQRRLRQRLST